MNELETIIKAFGNASGLGRAIGASPATISRWRKGSVHMNPRDVKLLRLIMRVRGWEKMCVEPVGTVEGLL